MNIFLSDSWEVSRQAEGRQAIEATGRGCAKGTKVEASNDTDVCNAGKAAERDAVGMGHWKSSIYLF